MWTKGRRALVVREEMVGRERDRAEGGEIAPRCLRVRTHGDVAVGTHCTRAQIYIYIYSLFLLCALV